MRTLDRKRPYVEVFGDVDETEKDKDGNPHVAHRYRQFGMMFDGQGELIGDEKEVPPEHEAEDQMRARIEAELRIKIRREVREEMAELAKTGGGDPDTKTDAAANTGAKKNAGGGEGSDLPGNLGKGDGNTKKKAA